MPNETAVVLDGTSRRRSVMAGSLAIAAYRCLVSGEPSDGLDFQVRWFADDDSSRIARLIEAEPALSYQNAEGETVSWELSSVMSIEPFAPRESGDEVVGFITHAEELVSLASQEVDASSP